MLVKKGKFKAKIVNPTNIKIDKYMARTSYSFMENIQHSKKMNMKMTRSFLREFTTGKSVLRKNAFTILYTITPFIDVDFSIRVDLDDFRKYIGFRSEYFYNSIDILIKEQYLIERNNRFYVTEKSHALIQSNEQITTYVNTYNEILSDSIFTLPADQFRGAVAILHEPIVKGYISTFYKNKAAKSNASSVFQVLNFKSFLQVLRVLKELNLIEFTLLNATNEVIIDSKESDADLMCLEKQYTNSNSDFIKSLKVTIVPQKHNLTPLNNVVNMYSLNKELTNYFSMPSNSIYHYPVIDAIFSDDSYVLNKSNNQLNLLINFKKELAAAITNKSLAVKIFDEAISNFFKNTRYTLASLVINDVVVNYFKDFYLMPLLEKTILAYLNMSVTIPEYNLNSNEVVFIDYHEILSKNDFDSLLLYFDMRSNTNRTIKFVQSLYGILEKAQKVGAKPSYYTVSNVLEDITSLYPSLKVIMKTYEQRTSKLYDSIILKQKLDCSLATFRLLIADILDTAGNLKEDTVVNYINRVIKFDLLEDQSEIIKEKIDSSDKKALNEAQAYPQELFIELGKKGYYSNFLSASKPIVEEYLNNLHSSYKVSNGKKSRKLDRVAVDTFKLALKQNLEKLHSDYELNYLNNLRYGNNPLISVVKLSKEQSDEMQFYSSF